MIESDNQSDFEAFEEDFEGQNASYQVWLRGYGDGDASPDHEVLVKSFSIAERAVEFAKEYVGGRLYETEAFPETATCAEVSVETVVEYEGHTDSVGTLFAAQFAL